METLVAGAGACGGGEATGASLVEELAFIVEAGATESEEVELAVCSEGEA